MGGAVRVDRGANISQITTDFVKVQLGTRNQNLYGGALYNEANINSITCDFVDVSTTFNTRINNVVYGAGIANMNGGTIGTINSDFYKVAATSWDGAVGGAIYNDSASSITNIISDFYSTRAVSYHNASNFELFAKGGVIANEGTIGSITGNFVGNNAVSYYGSSVNGTNSNVYGAVLTGGFRWSLGKDYSNIEQQVQEPSNDKKIINATNKDKINI